MTLTPKQVVQRSDEPLTPDEMARLTSHMSPYDLSLFHRAVSAAHAQGRARGLGEAVEVCEQNAKRWPDLRCFYVANECAAAIEQLRGK